MRASRRAVRSILACLAAVLAGCASEPPQRPVTPPLQPMAGEGQKAIAERAFAFVLAYQFEFDGHRYSLGNTSDAQQQDTYSELVFIDGQLACARERSMATLSDLDSDLTQWEQVGEPNGLERLAERLREACRLVAPAPPVASSPVGEVAGPGKNAESGSSEQSAGYVADALQDALSTAFYTSGIPIGASLLVAPLTFLIVAASKLDQGATAHAAAQKEAQWRAATTTAEVIQLLGKPLVEFSLPNVNTRVMAYQLGNYEHPYYVGLSDDKPVWFHNEYPWLHELAKQAIAQQAQDQKTR